MAKKLSELKPTDEVVVTLGARQDSQNGKVVTVEKERDVVMTFAGYTAIDTDEDGHAKALNRTAKLKGTPKYKKQADESMAGTHQEIEKVEEIEDDSKPAEPVNPPA